jgi:uncharacterized protein YndB with AHSA1/START domain
MRMPDGADHPFHGIYREILRPHRLVYTECYEMPQYGSPEWLTTITFDELPAETLVTHTIRHKSREVRDGHLQAGMQEGMTQTLNRLDEHTAAMHSRPNRNHLERSRHETLYTSELSWEL